MKDQTDIEREIIYAFTVGRRRRHAWHLHLQVLSDIANLRNKSDQSCERNVSSDAKLISGRAIGGKSSGRGSAVASRELVECHSTADERPEQSEFVARHLDAGARPLKRVGPFVEAADGLAVELDVIEAGIDSKSADARRSFDPVAKSILRAGDNRFARGRLVFSK